MFNTFNMGVGMAVVVPGDRADESVRILKEAGEDAYILGEIAKGAEKGVETMLNVAVLVSGGGTNLQAILDAKGRGALPQRKSLWCWPQSPACTRWSARQSGRARHCGGAQRLCRTGGIRRGAAGPRCGHRIDVVVLAGFCPSWAQRHHRVSERILNVHPA